MRPPGRRFRRIGVRDGSGRFQVGEAVEKGRHVVGVASVHGADCRPKKKTVGSACQGVGNNPHFLAGRERESEGRIKRRAKNGQNGGGRTSRVRTLGDIEKKSRFRCKNKKQGEYPMSSRRAWGFAGGPGRIPTLRGRCVRFHRITGEKRGSGGGLQYCARLSRGGRCSLRRCGARREGEGEFGVRGSKG